MKSKTDDLRIINTQELVSPQEIIDSISPSDKGFATIIKARNQIKNILNKSDLSKFKQPDVIFCDPKGAEELIANKFDFEQRLGWYFIPVVDEWVATADCNIEKENNKEIDIFKY